MKIEFVRRGWIISILSAISLMGFTTCCQFAAGGEKYMTEEIISGISFVAANEKVTEADITPILNVGATWASLMPYGFVRKTEHVVHFNTPGQWIGETEKGLIETIKLCQQKGLKVMIKPQVWLRHGEYTGAYLPPDSAMMVFENSFMDFVITNARIAQEVGADMYCIGTEWQNFINRDPEFWRDLIAKVKKVYSGKLTYAANWDEYKSTPFWDELDFIGVNAYFPLSDEEHPTIENMKKGWQPWLEELNAVATRQSKPILFTEYGYRSTVKNVSKPWESYTKPEISLNNQFLAYKTLYEELWHQPWFAGGFAWKWFHNHEERGGDNNIDYTPQNKPTEDVIRTFYTNPE